MKNQRVQCEKPFENWFRVSGSKLNISEYASNDLMNWGTVGQFLPIMSTLALELKVAYSGVIMYQEVNSNYKNSVRLTIECLHVDFLKNVIFISLCCDYIFWGLPVSESQMKSKCNHEKQNKKLCMINDRKPSNTLFQSQYKKLTKK